MFWYDDKSNSHAPLVNSSKIYIITRNGRNNLESYGLNLSSSIDGFSSPKLWKIYFNNARVYTIDKL